MTKPDMIATDDDILNEAQAWKEAGRTVAIATVIDTWGSAPRPVGSHLVIDGDGHLVGSISGGCVEAEIVAEAMDVIETGRPRLLELGVADDTACLRAASQAASRRSERIILRDMASMHEPRPASARPKDKSGAIAVPILHRGARPCS